MDDELVDDLRRELERFSGEGNDIGVEFLLEQLEEDEARVVRLCAIPHQFDHEMLALLAADIDAARREEIYEGLADLSLVVQGDEWLALEEEAREYLFNKWLESERLDEFKAVSGRLVEYYGSGRTKLVDDGQAEVEHVFHLFGASQNDGMKEFERLFDKRLGEYRTGECDYLVASVHEYDPVLTRPNRVRLAYHEGSLAAGRGEWGEATEFLSYVAEDGDGDAGLRAAASDRLGTVYAAQREWGSAVSSYQMALELLELSGGGHWDYRVMHNLAVAYRDSGGDLDRALDLLRGSVRRARKLGDLFWEAKCFNSLGTLYLRLNDNDMAVESYERSRGLLWKLGDHLGVAQVYNNLGLICLNREDWLTAVTHFMSSLREARQAGDTLTQAHALANLALADLNLHRLDSAEKSLRTAFVKYAEMRRPYLQAVAAQRLVATLLRAGRDDAAADFYSSAMQLFAESNAEREMRNLADEFGDRFNSQTPNRGELLR